MKCDKCDKEATVTVKAIINGKQTDFHLCNDCVKKFTDIGVDENGKVKPGVTSLDSKNIENLIGQFMPSLEEVIDSYYEYKFNQVNFSYDMIGRLGDEACPTCGNLVSNINNGVFGCPDCYKLDKKLTGKILRTYNNYSKYEGKFPRKEREVKDLAARIKNLQDKLQISVEIEDYERAATIKEEIEELTGKVGN